MKPRNEQFLFYGILITTGLLAFIVGFLWILVENLEAADFKASLSKSSVRPVCECSCYIPK